MTTALYYPYKAVGYVCDANAFCINRLGDETFLAASIGKSFQVHFNFYGGPATSLSQSIE